MIVGSPLFEAYLECTTKCWLRARGEPRTGTTYTDWARLKNETYYDEGRKRLLARFSESDRTVAPALSQNAKDVIHWRVATHVRLQANGLESHLQAIEKVSSEGRVRLVQLIPYRFQFTNRLTKNDKLSLAFDALVLSEAMGCDLGFGKIMHGDGHNTCKVKLNSLVNTVRTEITGLTALLADTSPPDLVLNRHCPQCEFQARCREQATKKDELSLLAGMSENERKKLRSKGIFTVTQLSYTFRPRRRRRQLRSKQEKFHHSLRALAIREKKIHVVDLLAPPFRGTPVYLDVEGLPDRDFYYLIGVRLGNGGGAVQYGFWADKDEEEKRIWEEFLNVLSEVPDPQLLHFGSYETVFLKRMAQRYGWRERPVASAIENAVNLLSLVFAHIYFPTFSNGFKEIGNYLGFQWSGSPASGLESIIWRQRWELSKDPSLKDALLRYNQEDCEALSLVAKCLVDLHREASTNGHPSRSDVIRSADMKPENPFKFGRIEFALPEMEAINKAAYWNYQRERVYVKSVNTTLLRRPSTSTHHYKPRPNITIDCPPPSTCPRCKSENLYAHGSRNKVIIDLRLTKGGIKRWITRYIIHRCRCQFCGRTFNPADSRYSPSKYGPNIIAYGMYQNIELGLPQQRVDSSINRLFGLHLPRGWSNKMKAVVADSHRSTYDKILKRLCSGCLLHVDETSVSVRGASCYVWALASLQEVAYIYTPTREGDTIQALLEDFSGVLVSDFYSAYDSINCPQQKCLIHLIRDLNEATLNHPYDVGLKQLVADFTGLLRSIVETVHRRGLKKRFLGKHRSSVHRFYRRLADYAVNSEVASKLVDRLQKNRDKMFTFLDFNDVPWNNNNAEHAVKAFATVRRIIEGPTTEKGLREFLVLLSICETCKCKNVDFLDFLRSGTKDIDAFASRQRKRRPLQSKAAL